MIIPSYVTSPKNIAIRGMFNKKCLSVSRSNKGRIPKDNRLSRIRS